MTEEHSLYTTREEALNAPGEVYEHYKGGIYRIHMRGVRDSEQHEERGIVYEHIWPHDHDFWYRPEEDFFSTLPDGRPRFKLVKKAS